MEILSTVQVTLKDDEAEKAFLEAFTKGAKGLDKVKGLLGLSAWKKLGQERTYMAFSIWESEEAIELWRQGDREKENVEMGKKELLQSFSVRRFKALGEAREWKKP